MEIAKLFASLGLRPDEKSWRRGNELIGTVKKALAAFAGWELVKHASEAINATVELGGHLDDLRQKTGLTAEALQEYGYAAKLGGSDMDGFAAGVAKLSRTFSEAAQGSKSAQDSLRRVGFSGKALKDALASGDGLDGALLEIAGRFADMPDGAQKTALAMDLFGRGGAALIPTLNQGAQGLAELRQEARDLGIVMSGADVAGLDQLGDDVDKAKMALTGLKNQAVVALAPMLQELVTGLLAWIKANRELIRSALTTMMQGLAAAARVAAAGIALIVDAIDFLREHGDLARALLIALGVVFGALAVEAAAAWVAATAPIVAVIAAITAVILVVQDLWSAFTDGTGVIASIARAIGDRFRSVARGIKSAFSSIVEFFRSIARGIRGAFQAVFDWIDHKLDWARGAYRAISDPIGTARSLFDAPSLIAKMERGGPAAMVPRTVTAARTAAAPGATTNTVNATIHVTSNATDPKAVADAVDRKLTTFWSRQLRAAHAGTGGDE